jgi:hypothetical protein
MPESSTTTFGIRSEVLSVEWARDSSFSRAVVRLHGKRVGFSSGLSDESAIAVGDRLIIRVRPEGVHSSSVDIFHGRILNITHTWSDPDSETVDVMAVDLRYDMFREAIFGQLAVGVDETTGLETKSGPYGGLNFLSGLPCLFNPKELEKNIEGLDEPTNEVNKVRGNARKITGFSAEQPFVFDCFPFAPEGEEDDADKDRGIRWSAYEMLRYLYLYMVEPPVSAIDDLLEDEAPLPAFLNPDFVGLGAGEGLDDEFPTNISVEGENGMEAFTTVCDAAGFSWWFDPVEAELRFWRRGVGRGKNFFYLEDTSDGLSPDEAVTLPELVTASWNVSAGEIVFNHMGIIDAFIGVTERQRIQQIYPLRKGWSDRVHRIFVDVLRQSPSEEFDVVAQPQGTHESTIYKLKGDFTGLRLIRHQDGKKIAIALTVDDKALMKSKKGAIFDFGRKWVTDEAGRGKSVTGAARTPYGYNKIGFGKIGGSTYCIAPRPFLGRNNQTDELGEQYGPVVFFGKFHPAQTNESSDKSRTSDLRATLDSLGPGAFLKEDEGGSKHYPFVGKQGATHFLKNIGGIRIDGGNLEYYGFTWDAERQEMFAFPPIALATCEHDQGAVKYIRKDLSRFFFARRKFDGSRFKFRKILAEDARKYIPPSRASDDPIHPGGEGSGVPPSTEILQDVDESDQMLEFMTTQIDGSAFLRAAGRVTIPTITTDYRLGDRVAGLRGRITDFLAVIVAIRFDFTTMSTEISLETEAFNVRGNNLAVQRARDRAVLGSGAFDALSGTKDLAMARAIRRSTNSTLRK